MRTNAPKKIVWMISLIAGIVGVVATYVHIPVISGIAWWIVLGGYALLLAANVVKGL